MSESNKPLEGIKLVELSTFVAAPSCCRYLADLGAEVIKVEPVQGDPLRFMAASEGRPYIEDENTSFDLENANKKCISLNLKDPKAMEVLHKLISEADIFVTNWRARALERAALDYETLKESYPSLVYGYVTGFGEKGPDKDLPGFDFTAYSARGGVLGTMFDKDHVPMNLIPGFGDHQVGMFLASGILAALFRAKNTGKGDKVIASLFHAAIWDLGITLQASQYGLPPTQWPMSRKEYSNPFLVAHKTKDNRWIQTCVPSYDAAHEKFLTMMEREDLVRNEKFFPSENLQNNLDEFYEIVKEGYARFTCEEWVKKFTEADIPFAVAQTWDELLVDEQAWANDYFYAMEYPTGATRTLVRPPVLFADTELPEYNRGPYLGENTEEILQRMGYSEEEISEMIEAKVARNPGKQPTAAR